MAPLVERSGPSLAWRRVLVLLAVAVLSSALAVVAGRVGAFPFGTAYEDNTACLASGAVPPSLQIASGPVVPATATRTLIPLGIICTINVAGHGSPTVVLPHQSWPATFVVLDALFTALLATVAALRTALRQVTRPRHWSSF